MKAKFKMKEGCCPMCNARALHYGPNELLDSFVRYPYVCQRCRFVGAEDYKLVFEEHIGYKTGGVAFLENPEE